MTTDEETLFRQGKVASDPALDQTRRASMAFAAFMQILGLNLEDEHLKGTPLRVARMYAEDLFSPDPVLFTTFPTESQTLIIERNISFVSLCSHHFLPFTGVAHIGYIPQDRIAGLSKLPRILDFHARRPQVQERLTEQVANDLWEKLSPLALGVVISAEHHCMSIRGARKTGVITTTSALRGVFLTDPAARAEFFATIRTGV